MISVIYRLVQKYKTLPVFQKRLTETLEKSALCFATGGPSQEAGFHEMRREKKWLGNFAAA
jgi:hypothetical protein